VTSRAARPTIAEQRVEEIAEATATELPAATFVVPARRRAEVLSLAEAAGAQLLIGVALARVLQDLVGLVDRLEALLGSRFLADVGVVLAGQPAIGGLDLRIAGARLHAERLVVVLELHGASEKVLRARTKR
jgi:hypothetical protein